LILTNSRKVCPRCGTPVGDGVWCDGCGLNLKQQADLPTADAYAAKVRERRWLEEQDRLAREQREAEAARKATDRERSAKQAEDARQAAAARRQEEKHRRSLEKQRKPSSKRGWIVAAVLVLALALVGGVAAFGLVGGSASMEQPVAALDRDEPPQVERQDAPESDQPTAGAERAHWTDSVTGHAAIEPTTIAAGNTVYEAITWESWGGTNARGEGEVVRSTCEPSCAEGDTYTETVTLTLTDIEPCGGRSQYSTGAVVYNESGLEEPLASGCGGVEPSLAPPRAGVTRAWAKV
jgi:uncharacterized Zn finger protein (UPF0148 family)